MGSNGHDAMVDRESTSFVRLVVEIAEAQRPGRRDVLRLADVEALAIQGVDRRACPRRRRVGRLFLTRWASTWSHSTWSIATGSVAKKMRVVLPCPLAGQGQHGPPWKTPRMPSMIWRTNLLRGSSGG